MSPTAIDMESKIKQLEERNLALASELSQVRTELAQQQAETRSLGQTTERVDRSAALAQQIRLLAGQIAFAETEVQRLREVLATSRGDLERRTPEVIKLREQLAHRSRAAAEQHAKIDELSRANGILTEGLETIEKHFVRLGRSRSFQFIFYTLGRLGLISHTPRRCFESMKDQFAAMHKAIGLVKTNVPAHLASARAIHVRGAESASSQTSTGRTGVPSAEGGPAELIPSAGVGQPASGARAPKNADLTRKIEEATRFRIMASTRNAISLPPPLRVSEDASVCLIVLHRGGENHLRQLFSSFLEVNTWPEVEFAVVLHACTDNSRDVIKSFQDRLNIKVTEHDKNYSFAYSNNRTAEQTSAKYLIFVNNDIIFQSDVIPELLRLLGKSRTGIVGARLLFPPDHPKYPNALQHGGVKFQPDFVNFFHRPWNVGMHIANFDTPAVPEKFPAVTAALAACRRTEFLEIGGFCEDYFYGYEDVDLCLSFRRILGLRAISANHVVSIHNESATGSLDSREATIRRRSNNIACLIRRHGWYLRRQISVDRLSGNLFFSDRPLSVAFAVTKTIPTTPVGESFIASELGEICAEFGWEIRYLAGDDEWYDLKGIDVLVVLLDDYDLPPMRNGAPDLIKVAWVSNGGERRVSGADFEGYDLILCASQKTAQSLREIQHKPVWVVPSVTHTERLSSGQHNDRFLSILTYRHWARTLKKILLTRARRGYRIAIKISAPNRDQFRHSNDYQFARSLGRSFAKQGHAYRIDGVDEWERPECFGDEVVIVLRGPTRYQPKAGQINLMWNISQPDKIEDDEYQEFDHVFVASQIHAEQLSGRLRIPVTSLLECTDQDVFNRCAATLAKCIQQLDSAKQSGEGLRNGSTASVVNAEVQPLSLETVRPRRH